MNYFDQISDFALLKLSVNSRLALKKEVVDWGKWNEAFATDAAVSIQTVASSYGWIGGKTRYTWASCSLRDSLVVLRLHGRNIDLHIMLENADKWTCVLYGSLLIPNSPATVQLDEHDISGLPHFPLKIGGKLKQREMYKIGGIVSPLSGAVVFGKQPLARFVDSHKYYRVRLRDWNRGIAIET